MKLLLLFQFILIYNLCLSQSLITDDSVVLKKGIYISFNEFKFNNPSLPLDYKIIEKSVLGVDLNYYRLVVNELDMKKVGEIFGFCDGENVYINSSRSKLTKQNYFLKLMSIGLFSYYEAVNYYPKGGAYLTGIIFDINTGEFINLKENNSLGTGKAVLKSIIGNDQEIANLIDDYKGIGMKQRNSFFNEYIKKYSLKYKDRIERKPVNLSFEVLLNQPTDTSYQTYCNRVINTINPFWETTLHVSHYLNGNSSYEGLITKNGDLTKIGLWRYYDKKGTLKKEIFYDLNGVQLYLKEYDKTGKLILEKI